MEIKNKFHFFIGLIQFACFLIAIALGRDPFVICFIGTTMPINFILAFTE